MKGFMTAWYSSEYDAFLGDRVLTQESAGSTFQDLEPPGTKLPAALKKALKEREKEVEKDLIERLYKLKLAVSISDPTLVHISLKKKVILPNRTATFSLKMRLRCDFDTYHILAEKIVDVARVYSRHDTSCLGGEKLLNFVHPVFFININSAT